MIQRIARHAIVAALLAIAALPRITIALPATDAPDPLRSWIPWVLDTERDHACPRGAGEGDRACVWPGTLSVRADPAGATFAYQVRVFRESWVPLPGERAHWPQDVRIGASPAIVTDRDGLPGVTAGAGTHVITGNFAWQSGPDSLRIPSTVALVDLAVGGTPVAAPTVDASHRLWLQPESGQSAAAPRVELRVSRLLVDDIPFLATTRIELVASGRGQEILLPPVLLTGFVPMAVTSPLAARLEPDGRLRIQVRPGRWEVRVTGRSSGPINQLRLPEPAQAVATRADAALAMPLPADEIWAIEARPALRLMTPEGGTPVDPQQTTLPADWKSHPTFRVEAGQAMRLVESRRGDPDPLPDRLTIARALWLDFDGRGYTVQDRIGGTLSRSWRLDMNGPAELGRVAIDGVDQLITRRTADGPAGFEVRRGRANVVADSRLTRDAASALGWAHDFQKASIDLQLPPGWRLVAATGVDHARGSWVAQWSLLDLFITFLVAVAVGKLCGWRWGVVALAALALAVHEADAPVFLWLFVIATVALVRVLPEGRIRQGAATLRLIGLAILALVLVAFVAGEVRRTLYPVLEQEYRVLGQNNQSRMSRRVIAADDRPTAPQADAAGDAEVERAAEPAAPPARSPGVRSMAALEAPSGSRAFGNGYAVKLEEIDPQAIVQTGPGLPAWQWQSHELGWSGPVNRDQSVGLWLLSPAQHGVVRIVRIVLLVTLFAVLAGMSFATPRRGRATGAAASALVAILAAVAPSNDARAQLPDESMLNELRGRLLAPPECAPHCAAIARMLVTNDRSALQLRLEVHAAAPATVLLPGDPRQWDVRQVLVDAKPATTLRRGEQGLSLLLERGVHQVVMTIEPGGRDDLQLALPMRPALVQARLDGWTIGGLRDNGVPGDTLQLARVRTEARGTDTAGTHAMRPLLRIERTLQLGLQWRMTTVVTRLSPVGAPVVQEIDLLPGESVTTADLPVKDGVATITLPAGATAVQWESALAESEAIRLVAGRRADQVEVWQLAAGTRWHVEATGIAVVQHQSGDRWQPRWHPWPGDEVTLSISRPMGVPGQSVTIDSSLLSIDPGARVTTAALHLNIRASRGEQHVLRLPEGAELENVTIRGQVQPIRLDGRELRIPLTPGAQEVAVQWREPRGVVRSFTTSAVDLGAASVNASIRLLLPRDRWILMAGGPAVGPAVLFWGVVAALLLVAFGLSRIPFTPLRFHHWLLLGLGFTQVPLAAGATVAGWLLLLGARRDRPMPAGRWTFNLLQLLLVLMTLVAIGLVFYAVRHGLLGHPDMQVAGNGSDAWSLRWFQDRSDATMPSAWIVTAPLFAYRLLMLAWALWLAWSLVAWLRWGWTCFASGGVWRKKGESGVRAVGIEPPPLPPITRPEGG